MNSSQQFTIMGVFTDARSPGDTSFREAFSNWDPSNGGTSVFLGTTNSDPDRVRFTDDFGGALDPAHNQTGVGALVNPTAPFILTGISTDSDASVYEDGGLLADKGSAISTRNLSTGFVIGRQGDLNSEYWDGDIAELLVYDRALSPAELQQNVSYLETKYDVADTPEPGTWALLGGLSIGGATFIRRRRRRK